MRACPEKLPFVQDRECVEGCKDNFTPVSLNVSSETNETGWTKTHKICVPIANICPKNTEESKKCECASGNSVYGLGEEQVCLQDCPTKFFKVEDNVKKCILPRDCVYRVEDTFQCTDNCGVDYYLKDNATCTKTRCQYVTRDYKCTTAEKCQFVV